MDQFIALLHVIGWGTLIFMVAPRYPAALGIGVGVNADLFGLRPAFNVDNISASDNTTASFPLWRMSDTIRAVARKKRDQPGRQREN